METKFNALGRHLLLELYDCNNDLLNQTETIEMFLKEAAKLVGATIVDTTFHHFSPYGVSGVVVIAESHITIHTWPEYDYAAIDVFTCDDSIPVERIVDYLVAKFEAGKFEQKLIKRGINSNIKTAFV